MSRKIKDLCLHTLYLNNLDYKDIKSKMTEMGVENIIQHLEDSDYFVFCYRYYDGELVEIFRKGNDYFRRIAINEWTNCDMDDIILECREVLGNVE
jgi:hypothetical protein